MHQHQTYLPLWAVGAPSSSSLSSSVASGSAWAPPLLLPGGLEKRSRDKSIIIVLEVCWKSTNRCNHLTRTVWELFQSRVVTIRYKRKARTIQVASSTGVWGASEKASRRPGRLAEVTPRSTPRYSRSGWGHVGKALKVGMTPSILGE